MIESSSIDAEGIGRTGDAADVEAFPFPVRGRDVEDDPFRHDFIGDRPGGPDHCPASAVCHAVVAQVPIPFGGESVSFHLSFVFSHVFQMFPPK